MAEHDCSKKTEIELMVNDISHIKEIVNTKLTSFHAEMMANHDVLMSEMRAYNEVLLERVEVTITLQKKTNGNVTEHDQEIKALGKQIIDERNEVDLQIEKIKEKGREIIRNQWFSRWIIKHPAWSIIILLFLIAGIVALVDFIGVKTLIEIIHEYK